MTKEVIPLDQTTITHIVAMEDSIETNEVFRRETPSRTLGRAEWLAVRSHAEFVILVTDPKLELTPKQQLTVINKVDDIISDFGEFILDGFEEIEDISRVDFHPQAHGLEKSTDKLIDLIAKNWGDLKGVSEIGLGDDLFELRAQDLIGVLKERRNVMKSQSRGMENDWSI